MSNENSLGEFLQKKYYMSFTFSVKQLIAVPNLLFLLNIHFYQKYVQQSYKSY